MAAEIRCFKETGELLHNILERSLEQAHYSGFPIDSRWYDSIESLKKIASAIEQVGCASKTGEVYINAACLTIQKVVSEPNKSRLNGGIMSSTEHIIENALSAIHNCVTFDQWVQAEKKLNLPYVKSDPQEIWDMAWYVYYSGCWKHWTED